jgi:hypothetical protein
MESYYFSNLTTNSKTKTFIVYRHLISFGFSVIKINRLTTFRGKGATKTKLVLSQAAN